MTDTQSRNCRKHAWKKHRQELGVWLFCLVLYLVFLRGSESEHLDRLKGGLVAFIFLIPPLFLVRFFRSARKCRQEMDELNGSEGD